MQSVNARSQERALVAELEDEPRLIATIIKAHEQTCDYTQDKVAPLLQRARDEPVYTQCPPQLACPLNPNPQPLQNGNQRILEDFSERFSPAIRGVVEFAKRIPGFSLLSQDDQVTLLKAGVFEVLLVRLACMFDSHSNTMLCLNGQVLKRESVHNSSNARFLMDSMFDFAERLNMLRLQDADLGLFCAVVIITSDRPGLRNVELVEKMQSKLMMALQNVASQQHPELPGIFQELMKKIPDLRTLNTLHSEKLLAFKMEPRNGSPTSHKLDGSVSVSTAITSCMASTPTHLWTDFGMPSLPAHQSPAAASDDSKGSWEERDLIRSPGQPSSAGSDWSIAESKEHGSETYGSPRSIDAAPYGLDENGMPKNTADSESVCSGEVARISDLQAPNLGPPKRRRDPSQSEGGVSSGDEGSVADSPARCPFKLRKLESPSGDSGIESGKEAGSSGSHSTGTSMCGSPRSLVDEKVKDVEACYTDGDNAPKLMAAEPHNSVPDPTDDMPVLKRALQAPPLINTNLLMDEAYKPHKKFRALRKDLDTTNAEPMPGTVPLSSSHSHHQTLASTHSMLVRSLEQGPRMSKQQLKRTDIIHNIIMRTESNGLSEHGSSSCSVPTTLYGQPAISNTPPVSGSSSAYNASSPSFVIPGHSHHVSGYHVNGQALVQQQLHPPQLQSHTSVSKNIMVCAPNYIPQPNMNMGPVPSYAAAWPFVTPTSNAGLASNSPIISQALQVKPTMSGCNSQSNLVAIQMQASAVLPQLSPQIHSSSMSSPLHRLQSTMVQGSLPATSTSQPTIALQPGSSSPQLPRMYYDPRSSTPSQSPSGGASPPAVTSFASMSQSPSLSQQGYTAYVSKPSSTIPKSSSPVMGQVVELQVEVSENQPLNLSKKTASPPPTPSPHEASPMQTALFLHQEQMSMQQQLLQHKIKLEGV